MNSHRRSTATENSPRTPDGRRHTALRAAGILAVSGALVGGVLVSKSGDTPNATSKAEIQSTATPLPKIEQDFEVPHPKEAADYYYSKARDTMINNAIIAATARIIADMNKRNLNSSFTFRPNGDEQDTKHKPGWGQLEHYASEGQFPHDVIISTYRNSDGSYEAKNGVESFTLLLNDDSQETPEWTRISFLRSPALDPKLPNAWSSMLDGSDSQTISSSEYGLNTVLKSADELEDADTTVLKMLPEFVNELEKDFPS